MRRAVTIALMCIIMIFTLTACGERTPLTSADIESMAISEGLTITDLTAESDDSEAIENEIYAENTAENWAVDFAVLSDETAAQQAFANLKTVFEASAGNATATTSVNVGNYQSYSISSNGQYMYVSRTGNTLIYTQTESSNKESVKDFISKLEDATKQ